jgi:hypothetical protein
VHRVLGFSLFLLSLALVIPLRAQTTLQATGSLPQFAQRPPNLPISLPPVRPPAVRSVPSQNQLPKLVQPQKPGTAFSRLFPKITLGSWPPKPAPNTVLQGRSPYQPNPMLARNAFDPPPKKKKN